MEEYVGGISVGYLTNEQMLERGLKHLRMIEEGNHTSEQKICISCSELGSYIIVY